MRSFSRLVALAFAVLVLFLLPSRALAAPVKAPAPGVRGVSGDLSALPTWWLALWSRGSAPRAARAGSPAALAHTWAKAGSAMDPNGTVIIPPPPPPIIYTPPA